MDLLDEITPLKSNNRFMLLKSNSTNNYGSSLSSFFYNKIRRETISARPRAKSSIKNGMKKSKTQKKNMVLSDTPLFFSEIKNKNVRNFYETVLRNCCKEKEPKERLLKNLFRINNNKKYPLLLKTKNKKKFNKSKSLISENIEKKSKTSNNLPFILISQNNNNTSHITNINNDIEKTNFKITNNIKIQSLLLKDAKDHETNKQSNKLKFYPISKNMKKSQSIKKTNLFKNFIIAEEREKEIKKYNNPII